MTTPRRLMLRLVAQGRMTILGCLVLLHSAVAADAPVYRAQGLDTATRNFVLGNFEFVSSANSRCRCSDPRKTRLISWPPPRC
jgi:hypothetical protein